MKKHSISQSLVILLVGILMMLGASRVHAAPGIAISGGGSVNDIGTVDLGANPNGTVTRTFSVAETGDETLTWSVGSISGGAGQFSAVRTSGDGSIENGGGAQQFRVTFNPGTVRGTFTATLAINNNSGTNPFQVRLSGRAIAPVIQVSQPSTTQLGNNSTVNYTDTTVNDRRDLIFTVKNDGDASLRLDSATIGGQDPRLFEVIGVSLSAVPAGGSRVIRVRFSPTATRNYSANITIASNSAPSSFVVNLQGTGIASVPLKDEFGYEAVRVLGGNLIPFIEPADPGVLRDVGLTGIDKAVPVDIGFDFFFYERSYSRCSISTTGLITFEAPSTDFTPDNIPNDRSPDAFIAPLWTDLQIDGMSSILYQTQGVAPNRIFIVKYDNVILYNNGAGTGARVTFQVQLYETSNSIQVRYGAIVGAAPPAQALTIGIESRNYGNADPRPGAGVVDGISSEGVQYFNGFFNNPAIGEFFPGSVLFTRPVVVTVESKYEKPTPTVADPTLTTATNVGDISLGLDPSIGTIYKTAIGTVSRFEAPEFIYLNRDFTPLAAVGDTNAPEDEVAWYRLVNDGYALDGQVVQGTQLFFTATLTHDVTVIWRWRLEYAVLIDSATGGGGFGNPVPEVGRHWYSLGEQVTALIDSSVEDPGAGFRFRSKGYSLFDKNGVSLAVNDEFDPDAERQAITPFSVAEPRRIKWEWTGQVRYRFSSALASDIGTYLDSQAFVKVFAENGIDPDPDTGTNGIVWANGEETNVWVDSGSVEGRKVEAGIFYRTNDRCFTLTNFNSSPGGDLGSLGLSVSGLDERMMNDLGGNSRLARFFTVEHAENPTTISWNYGPTVYRAIVPLGQSFDATNPDLQLVPRLCDGAVLAITEEGPGDGISVVDPPDESTNKTAEPLKWDSLGKQLFPVHPGSYQVDWPDRDGERTHRIEIASGFPGDPIELFSPLEDQEGNRQTSAGNFVTAVTAASIDPKLGFPASADNAHYRHLFATEDRRPPTKLDLNEADQWQFLDMTFSEGSTSASVVKGAGGVPFTADGPGRSVLLYTFRPNPNEIADDNLAEQNLAVRIVKSSPVNSILRDDPRYVLGRRGLVLGHGDAADKGAVSLIQRNGGPSSVTPGDHYVIDFWLNTKGLTAPLANSLSSCTTTEGSATVICSDTGKLEAGFEISGTNIEPGTTVAAVTNATTLQLSAPANASGTELTLSAIDKRPVTVIQTGPGGLVVTLDAAASTVTATFGDLAASVTHPLPKAGANWRHFAFHLFENRFFNSPVTILDFYLDGVRGENGALGHLLTGADPINVTQAFNADSLTLGAGVNPEDGIEFDQLRLFSLTDDNEDNPWLTAGEVRQLRMDAVSPLREVAPQLNFGFEDLPTDGTFANASPGVNLGIGRVSNDAEVLFSGAWARLDIEEVATRLDSTLDNANFSGGGYVLNPVSNYNADLHIRDSEIGTWGPIFPVNDGQLFTDPVNRLEIAYYENPFLTEPQLHPNVAWPYISAGIDNVTYPVFGAHKDKAIYIASRIGSEGVDQTGRQQQIYNLDQFADLKLYNQPSRDEAGYNPNEEHALIAVSGRAALKLKNVGSEVANNPPMAAFALQENINATSPSYTSDPWVLVQVNNVQTGEPEMSAYRVFETRAGAIPFPRPADLTDTSTPGRTILGVDTIKGLAYESAPNPEDRFLTLDPDESYDFNYQFTFPVFAGDLLIPPYPLNVVIGNVPSRETRGGNMDVNGVAQVTYWTDVNKNAWVVSGNGRFFQQFFYPLRPDFYLSGVGVGNPVPWVPVDSSGNHVFTGAPESLEPGRVIYSSAWRADYPKLKRGETLTYQGGEYFAENPGANGLPALVAMKAAQVVYDDSTKDMFFADDADLNRYSARIIRPLDRIEERFTVAEMAEAGFSPAASSIFVVAERWYFRELPGSLQKRFYFDSLAQKLVFRGYLNDKDSGDPDLTSGPDPLNVLEPNIITTAERDRMLPLGSGRWPEVVEKIFAKSQNPMMIREATMAGNPSITGKYLAGMKESPILTTRLGLNTELLGLNADLAEEQAKLATLTADQVLLNTQWTSSLNFSITPVGISTSSYVLLNGLALYSAEEIVANRLALEQSNQRLSELNASISTLQTEITEKDSQRASNFVHLDSFGVGSALVCNPGLLTAPVDGSRYITIAENNRSELDGAAISLHIIEIIPDRYRGAIKVIEAADAFSERVTLQHNGDFGANTDDLYYEWWIRDAAPLNLSLKREIDSLSTATPDPDWQQYLPEPVIPKTAAELAALGVDAEDGKHLGLHTIVFEGRPDVTLADKLVMVRYRHKFEDGWNLVPFEVADSSVAWKPGKIAPESAAPFQWAGAANSPQLQADGSKRYIPQLVAGWVKRVLDRINPYEARYNDFFSNESPATYSSQIQIAGAPFAGKVALNSDKNVIENTGLIELYETVLARARELSIDNSSNGVASDGIQQALLLAATRLSVLYELLAREAYSDAQDPTITVSDAGDLASVASFTHAFQNMEADLQHEELALLRGTDFLKSFPVYNRIFWNYAKGLGEAAYNVNYNIYDENSDGFINEDDARALYPQGHGDAWGHFGSSIGMSYTLLQSPGFSWKTRSELYSLMQNVLEVDFLDEKTFAKLAAGRARTGRDIVRGTYRLAYTQDPDGQWQGYTDAADPARAWGVSGWAHRTGQSAYFDWLVANALLPESADRDPSTSIEDPENLDLLERSAAEAEIGEVAGGLHEIQVAMDEANGGVNPLGFDTDALSFDLNLEFYENASGGDRRSHFEQIHGRAIIASNNALATLGFATQAENKLRSIAESTDELIVEALSQDIDYRNRLIEIFGRPYDGTIGFGKAFPEGYEGPDTQLFSYLDRTTIDQIVPPVDGPAGTPSTTVTFNSVYGPLLGVMNDSRMVGLYSDVFGGQTATNSRQDAFETLIGDNDYLFEPVDPDGDGPLEAPTLTAPYNTASKFAFQAPADWGQRTSYGRIQTALESMLADEIELDAALIDYIGFLQDWEAKAQRLSSELAIYEEREGTTDTIEQIRISVNATILAADTAIGIAEAVMDFGGGIARVAKEAGPTSIGFSNDVGVIARAIGAAGDEAANGVFNAIKNTKEIVQRIAEFGRDESIAQLERDFARLDAISGLEGMVEELVNLSGADQPKRDTIALVLQNLEIHRQEYFTAQAEGFRLLREREAFNKILAAKVQKNRYNDMIFRLSRNEVMTKYQTAFNHAARYTWLAARAYDYETSLDPGDPAAPGALLDQIVKERQLGLWVDGEPRAGQGGLAEILNLLGGNFEVLKGQLGINNPQVDFERMSLRQELFRIGPAAADGGTPASDDRWKDALKARIIPDLTKMPEFVRYCRPFSAAGDGPQPGIVIRFGSHINNGVNFFGNVLAPGDHAYSTANYANKIRGFGLWMENYNEAGLSTTPRAYLVPIGTDILRTSSTEQASIRTWNILEQRIPVPFVINQGNLSAPGYIPPLGGVDGGFGQLRRHGDFRVFHDDGDDEASDDELQLTSRLISRSVWNSEWMIVIPGAGLDADPMTGLIKLADTIEDIRLQFSTYSHQGQ